MSPAHYAAARRENGWREDGSLELPQNWVSVGLVLLRPEYWIRGRARRLRIQYPGARYHVINRGNLQHDVFATFAAKNAFLITLDEAAVWFGWLVHSFVVMRITTTSPSKRRSRTSWTGCTGCNLRLRGDRPSAAQPQPKRLAFARVRRVTKDPFDRLRAGRDQRRKDYHPPTRHQIDHGFH